MNRLTEALSKRFSPSQIQQIYLVSAVLIFFAVIWFGGSRTQNEELKVKEKAEVTNVLTSESTKRYSIDAVNAKVESLHRDVEGLEQSNKNLQKNLEDEKASKRSSEALARELKATKYQLEQMEKRLAAQNEEISERVKNAVKYQMDELKVDAIVNNKDSFDPNRKASTSNSSANQSAVDNADCTFSYGGERCGRTSKQRNTTNTTESNNQRSDSDTRSNELFTVIKTVKKRAPSEATAIDIDIPSGSILTGVLQTGIDAPTQASAQNNPMPVLIRIKKEAILPNLYTQKEVNECFLLAYGYGDLSSERAQFRAETLSCITKNGLPIEHSIAGYAVGEDGKSGLKGKLVSRNSTVLAKTMMAGFMSSVAGVFNKTAVPTISTNPTQSKQFQDAFSSDALQSGAAKGAANAMEKLADYYLKLADQMHPVIEVGAGRVVHVVVHKGTGKKR